MRALRDIAAKTAAWLARNSNDTGFFYTVAVCMGIVCGAAAALLKGCIDMVTHFVFSSSHVSSSNWEFFLLPIGGIMLAVLYTRYIARQPMDHATERTIDDLKKGTWNLSPRLIFGPIISCSLTLGFGGSAGGESPIAYTGAAIGSNIGKVCKLKQCDIETLLGCGAAAGIAGIFMAPIGGVMYAIEVLKMRQSLQTVVGLTFSSLVSALTCYILLGCHTDVTFVPEMRFDTHLIPWVLLCGVFCGIYSVYYHTLGKKGRSFFGRFNNIWYKALCGGCLLGGMLFLFPSLYGEGYNIIGKLMQSTSDSIITYSPLYPLGKDFTVLMLLFVALLLIKPLAVAATNDSGGVGGGFTPTFFAGGVAGYLFVVLVNHLFGLDLPCALFAFFGMAAVMAGVQRAPLMSIFIAAEMTGMYGFILPLTIATVASFIVTIIINRGRIVLPGAQPTTPTSSNK